MQQASSHYSNLIRRRGLTALGVLIALILIAGGLVFYLSQASATGESAVDTRIHTWVDQLSEQNLTPARHLAQQHLEESGAASVGPLTSALHSPNPTLRRNAAEMLGFIASPDSADSLVGVLQQDPVASVRDRAAWALGELHDLHVVGALQRAAVVDSSLNVRQSAVSSLDAIRAQLAAAAGQDEQQTSAFAIAPSQPSVVYLAALDEISVSRDGGQTWEAVSGTPPSRVAALAVSPTNPDVLYAGTESAGLYKSTDGGTTWVAVNRGLGLEPGVRLTVTAIAIDAQNADRVYIARGTWVGTSQAQLVPLGVMLSLDGGSSWQSADMPATDQGITGLILFNNSLYAAAGDRVVSTGL